MMNSETIWIRDSIPPYRICAVELSLNKILKKEHDSAHQQHLYWLSQSGAEDAAEEFMSHLNSQKHHWLSQLTSHIRLEQMMKKKRRSLVKDINKWYEKDTDHSMSYFHKVIKVDPFDLTFQDQYSFMLWLSWMSLKLCYLTEIIKDKIIDVSKKERLLIFSQWLMMQWLVKGFLSLLELKVLLIQSHHLAAIRVSTIKMFNDHNADVDVLSSLLWISWEGTNFY